MPGDERVYAAGDVAWLAALTIGAALLWVVRIDNPDVPYNMASSDAFGYALPAYDYEARRLAEGAVPLWNPYQATGVPFVGTLPAGALYPPRLLLLATSPIRAMEAWAFGHLLLALLATYLLCRRLGSDRAFAAIGGIVFVRAFALPWILIPSLLEPGAWLPLLALLVVQVLSGGGWPWVLALGAAAAMPILAGNGQLTLYTGYALGIVAAAVWLDRRAHGLAVPPGRWLRLAAAAALAACTAAPQALTAIGWSAESMRPTRALTDLQMMPLMTEAARAHQIGAFFFTPTPADLGHFSLPVIALAVVGACAGGLVGLVLALGGLATALLATAAPGSWLFELYKSIPGVVMFRFPTRILFVTALFVGVAAALGGTRLARAAVFGEPWRRRLVGAAALVVVLVALVVPYRMIGLAPWAAWPTLTDPHPWLVPEGERPSDAYRVWVPGDRFDLGFGTFVRQGLRHGIRVVQDYEPASSRRLGAFLSAVAGRPFGPGDDAVRFTGALLGDPPIERPALLDLVSARHVVVPEDRPPADRARGWIEVTRHPRYAIYRNDRALSRAYLVQRARFVPDEAAALDAIVDPSFDGQTEAVVVGGPDGPEARSLADGPRAPATAIPMAIDEPERIVLEVEPARASLVVVTDAFAPGWSARVDGAERELRQVNYLVRGVLVAPGDRRVELRYAAPGFVPGLALALSGWGVALVVIASARTRRRRSPT